MLPPLQFNDAEIIAMAARMGLEPPDGERHAILKCATACEVQAGPGSGKTTLLAVKLALLADQWADQRHGICVLSHTNAARNEIESRVSQSATLVRLLGYPHFIGTFQTFADQFLAIPLLRTGGILNPQIDDDGFGAKAWSRFQRAEFNTARGWLNQRQEYRRRAIIEGLRYADSTLRVESAATDLPKAGSATHDQLKKLKNDLAKEGFFRFDDMFALADRALVKFPYLRAALRRRFPWVFVDELQDTRELQTKLINDLFPSPDCVVQCYGDRNQSIFDFDGENILQGNLFGQRPVLPLSSTRRFGNAIATLSSPFTAASPQVLTGFPARKDCPNTLFLFKKENVTKVLQRFGDLAFQHVPKAGQNDQTVCVVGRRKRGGEFKDDHFPVSLGDYWDKYNPEVSIAPADPTSLVGYCNAARCASAETRTGASGARVLLSGLLEFVAEACREAGIPFPKSRRALREKLIEAGTWSELQMAMWRLLDLRLPLNEINWNAQSPALAASLGCVLPENQSEASKQFLAWVEADANGPVAAERSPENIYLHPTAAGALPIRFCTVHAVKGQTHAATLLVETYSNKSHDLKSLLPVLTGDIHGSALPAAKLNCCMCAFVAVTRPTTLVCLAMAAAHVPAASISKITARGWAVETLPD